MSFSKVFFWYSAPSTNCVLCFCSIETELEMEKSNMGPNQVDRSHFYLVFGIKLVTIQALRNGVLLSCNIHDILFHNSVVFDSLLQENTSLPPNGTFSTNEASQVQDISENGHLRGV